MIKDKKAQQIPVLLMIIGTAAICVFAIILFSIKRDSSTADIEEFNKISKINTIADRINFIGQDNRYSTLEFFELQMGVQNLDPSLKSQVISVDNNYLYFNYGDGKIKFKVPYK